MESDEIDHLENEWPPEKRNEARMWVVDAVDANRSVAFAWKLFAGENPSNSMDDPGAPDPVRVPFLSPRQGLRLSWLNYGEVPTSIARFGSAEGDLARSTSTSACSRPHP